MSKKKLDISNITNELRGQSVYFRSKTQEPTPQELEQKPIQEKRTPVHTPHTLQASNSASIDASKHASTLAIEIDLKLIHKTLKLIGKEVLYVRLTPEEKSQVNDIEYTYQRQGIKTSGNEIGRIALNFLLADYKANGEQSILAKMLTELHT
jgi:hypothetical protein